MRPGLSSLLAVVLVACAAPTPAVCPKAPEPPAVVTVPPPPPCSGGNSGPSEPAPPAPAPPPSVSAEVAAAPPPVIAAAQGGPRGVRPCEFHESVDTYHRSCTVKQNADGSLTVTAPGTALNPGNGFTFRMGGGPQSFTVSGQLDAFGICKGPFSGSMIPILDGGKKIYEARFREHCMIVVR